MQNKPRRHTFRLFTTEYCLVGLLLIVAALLRFYHYGSFSYSNDELSAIARAQYPTFSELVQKGFFVDGHPGGIQVLMWLWIMVFGLSETSIRLPFVLMGLVSVFLAYKVGRQMFGKWSGLFSGATIAFLQFPLLFSQIARPYGPGMMFGLLMVSFWHRIFYVSGNDKPVKQSKLWDYIGFSLAAAACMYTHYFAFLFALIVGLSGFLVSRKGQLVPYLLAALGSAVLFAPHISITLNHLSIKGLSGWLGLPGIDWPVRHLWFIFDHSWATLAWVVAAAVIGSLWNRNKNDWRLRFFLATWFLAPIIIGYVYSYLRAPVLQDSVLIFSFPYLIILIFSFVGKLPDRFENRLFCIYLLGGALITVAWNGYYLKQHFGEFKGVAQLSGQWNSKYGKMGMSSAIAINNPYYLNFYLQRQGHPFIYDTYELGSEGGIDTLENRVSSSKKDFFMMAITKPLAGNPDDIVRGRFPYRVEYKDYQGLSSISVFSRKPAQSYAESLGLHLFYEKYCAAIDPKEGQKDLPDAVYAMNPEIEYSRGFDSLFIQPFACKLVEAEVSLFADSIPTGSLLVLAFEKEPHQPLFWAGAKASWAENTGAWGQLFCTWKPEGGCIPKGSLNAYVWNPQHKSFQVSKIRLTLYR